MARCPGAGPQSVAAEPGSAARGAGRTCARGAVAPPPCCAGEAPRSPSARGEPPPRACACSAGEPFSKFRSRPALLRLSRAPHASAPEPCPGRSPCGGPPGRREEGELSAPRRGAALTLEGLPAGAELTLGGLLGGAEFTRGGTEEGVAVPGGELSSPRSRRSGCRRGASAPGIPGTLPGCCCCDGTRPPEKDPAASLPSLSCFLPCSATSVGSIARSASGFGVPCVNGRWSLAGCSE